jgi:hypothetical protein
MIKLKLLHQHRGENHHQTVATMRNSRGGDEDGARDVSNTAGSQALADINGNVGVHLELVCSILALLT